MASLHLAVTQRYLDVSIAEVKRHGIPTSNRSVGEWSAFDALSRSLVFGLNQEGDQHSSAIDA